MPRMKKRLWIAALAAAAGVSGSVVGAEPTRFDTSSREAIAQSNARIAKGLEPEQRKQLMEAIIKLGMVGGAEAYTLPDGTQSTGIPPEKIRAFLDGKTAQEVIELARRTESPVESVEFKVSK